MDTDKCMPNLPRSVKSLCSRRGKQFINGILNNAERRFSVCWKALISPLTMKTRRQIRAYQNAVIMSREVSVLYNLIAAMSGWFVLAGFVFLPGTFEKISHNSSLNKSQAGGIVLHAVRNIPLLAVGSFCCCVGVTGIGWVWKKVRNHVWLVDRVFLWVFPSSFKE